MVDQARKQTNKILVRMEKEVSNIYARASDEISEKWYAYMKSHEPKVRAAYADLQGALKSGEYKAIKEAKDVYERTVKNVTLNNNRFKAMVEETTTKLSHVNEVALDYVNNNMAKVYTLNYNAFADQEIKGYSFSLVNEEAVKNLATKNRSLLPKKKLDIPKDKRWNVKSINSQVLQGILQGESIPKIANRLQNVTDMNRNSAIRNARTMTTSAENKGRLDSFKKAQDDGVIMSQVWIATRGNRTRDWHADLDGKEVEIDEPWENAYGKIMYPGDPSAHPANVYNCRCAIRAVVKGFAWNGVGKTGDEIVIFNKSFSQAEINEYAKKDPDKLFEILTNKYSEEDVESLLNPDDTFDITKLNNFLFGHLPNDTLSKSYKFSKAMNVSNECLNISPSTLVGKSRGNVMDFVKADSGAANRDYGKVGYDINCQSCVVSFEARLRGYDVTAEKYNKVSEKVSLETRKAWLTKDGNKPRYVNATNVSDSDLCEKWLDKKIKEGERYTFEFNWTGGGGHIVTAFKDDKGLLTIYDPQIDKITQGKDIKSEYLNAIDYTSGYKGPETKLLRVDNLTFNSKIVDKILK